jgi:hypothetical protein
MARINHERHERARVKAEKRKAKQQRREEEAARRKAG